MYRMGISKVAVTVCCMALLIATPLTATAQTNKKNLENLRVDNVDLTLKQISSRSWEALNITRIELNYNSHSENIIVEASDDNNMILDEYNSVNDNKYVANVVLNGNTLIITQSTGKPSSGYDSEARLYIPANYNGTIVVNDMGNIRISNMTGLASYDITNDQGVVSLMSMTASSIEVKSSFSGELTMRDVTSVIDVAVIGTIVINGNSSISGIIRGSDGTRISNIGLSLMSINGDLKIEDEGGIVCVDFPPNSEFKINATTTFSIANNYSGGVFQTTMNTMTGSSGSNPVYTVDSTSGTFLLDTAK